FEKPSTQPRRCVAAPTYSRPPRLVPSQTGWERSGARRTDSPPTGGPHGHVPPPHPPGIPGHRPGLPPGPVHRRLLPGLPELPGPQAVEEPAGAGRETGPPQRRADRTAVPADQGAEEREWLRRTTSVLRSPVGPPGRVAPQAVRARAGVEVIPHSAYRANGGV